MINYKNNIFQCLYCHELNNVSRPFSELVDEKRWYPHPIWKFKNYVEQYIVGHGKVPELKAIRANIAYSFQYLQYLKKTIEELNISSVIYTQTYKTYVIVGTSIIEAVLYMVVCNNDLNVLKWVKKKKIKTHEFELNGEKMMCETLILESPKQRFLEEISLQKMIRKVQQHKLISDNTSFYSKLNGLRKLRNLVHLHISDEEGTDYKTFNLKEEKLISVVLHELILSPIFKPNKKSKELFEYLVS